ncbi:MAG: hypothetical protein ACR5LG_12260 [Sodalis sp. (in: enterobacteria)]|uniref:hypothetical protein n=1 Tax=Sodalis sp. (in: enterobacteria) TaxID=1898979 RepID=UPI003F2FD8EB
MVAALAGGAGYWRGTQQARLVAQATLATRQAECEARQRQPAQATQQALKTALIRQQQLQGPMTGLVRSWKSHSTPRR